MMYGWLIGWKEGCGLANKRTKKEKPKEIMGDRQADRQTNKLVRHHPDMI